MGLSNNKVPIIVGAAVAAIAIAASSVTYFTTTYSSMTMAMLEIMDDEKESQETKEEEDDPPEDPDKPEPTYDDFFDELHKMIAYTDMSKIPDDARLDDELSYLNPSGWNLKTYLQVYQLLAEICLRPDVNPPDTDVVITPMILLGKMATESGLCTQNGYTGFKDSVLLWQSKESMISQCDGLCRWCWQLHSGDNFSLNDYANAFTIPNLGYACGGPVGQSYLMSFNWDSGGSAYSCIYISKEENPTLDDSKRGIVGLREDIYSGNAVYPTEDFWKSPSTCEKASYDEVKSNIKQGIFDSDTPMGYQTRPASYFVPDACYTLALSMRAALEDKNPLTLTTSYGYDYMKLVQLAGTDINKANTQYAMLALSLYPQLTPASYEVDLSNSAISNKAIGAVAELYGDMLYNDISFIPISKLPVSEAIQVGYYPGNIVAKFVEGVDSLGYYTELANGIPETYMIENTAIEPILHQLLNSDWEYSLYKCEYNKGDPALAPYNALSSLGGEAGYGMWYSFNCVNVGYMYQQSCDAHIRYAYATYGNPYESFDDKINGLTCLGEDCWHNKHPISSRSNKISYISQIEASNVCSEVLSTSSISNETLDLLSSVKLRSVDHNKNIAIYKDLALPVTFENAVDPDLLLFCTYKNHPGDSVDFHVEDYNCVRHTGTSEIHAIADGVVTEIRQFPYYFEGSYNTLKAIFSTITADTQHPYNYASCGNMIVLMHKDENGNTFYSKYMHLKDIAHISVGSVVSKGALLGYTGTTGFSTGAHPHITVLNASGTSIGYLFFVKSYLYDLAPGASEKLDGSYYTYDDYVFVIKRKEDGTWEYAETRYSY